MSGAQHGSVHLVVEEFRPLLRGSLRGFARVRFPDGLVIPDIELHVAGGRAWASPHPLIGFSTPGVREAWSAAVVSAVREAFPEEVRSAPPGRAP